MVLVLWIKLLGSCPRPKSCSLDFTELVLHLDSTGSPKELNVTAVFFKSNGFFSNIS